MQKLKFISLFLGMALLLIISTSQKPKTEYNGSSKSGGYVLPQLNDSTSIISISDANEFIKILGNVPHDQYSTLEPKQVIREFVNWKLQLLSKKALPDSTTKKK